MNESGRKTAMIGPRRFQWQIGGWFGSLLGGSAWLIPTGVLLAISGQLGLALLPLTTCVLLNVLGIVLWYRRDRVRPFPALVAALASFALLTPIVWVAVSTYATPKSLAALNWPQQSFAGAIATLIFPAIIAWFCFLEYSHSNPLATGK